VEPSRFDRAAHHGWRGYCPSTTGLGPASVTDRRRAWLDSFRHGDIRLPRLEVYRYAPWFAWLWVPRTYLPRDAVSVVWCICMLGLSCLAVWPVLRTRSQAGVALALFTWPMMAYVSIGGNVHAALVAGLVYGLQTRWAPLAIALAASLKAAPLALSIVYLGRRDYRRFAITVGLTALLVAPMLLYGIDDYTTDPGGAVLLTGWVWFVAVGAASLLTITVARTRYAWLAGATTVALAFPRWFIYDASFVLAGAPKTHDRDGPPSD
jgi:hypothetical protein